MSEFTIIPNTNANLVYVRFLPVEDPLSPDYVPEDDLVISPIIGWYIPVEPEGEDVEPIPVGVGMIHDDYCGAILNLEDDRWYRYESMAGEGREALLAELKLSIK